MYETNTTSWFVGYEQFVEYVRKTLLPMFFICHYHLHPSFQFGANDVHGGMRISTCISLKETECKRACQGGACW